MSGPLAAGFEATGRTLLELKAAFQGIGISVDAIFKPAVDGFVKTLIDIAEGFNNSVRQGGVMKGLLDTLAISAQAVASAFAGIAFVIEDVWQIGKAAALELANEWQALGKILYGAFTLNGDAIKSAWSEMLASNNGVQNNFFADLQSNAQRFNAEMETIWHQGAQAAVQIEQTKQAQLNILNKEGVSAQLAATEGQIKAAQMAYQTQAELLKSQLKDHQITQEQMTAATIAAVNAREDAELAALAKEEQIGGLVRDAIRADLRTRRPKFL